MSWGVPNRPKISTKIGRPTNREGADGDTQIKGTALGAKLFAKWSGRWWDVPLSIDGVTKIGTTDSDYLSIDRDSVDIYTNSVKVASFGSTTTVKDINLTGKITITSDGDRNVCIGTWSSGNPDSGDDNICIGVDTGKSFGGGANQNICIGTYSGDAITDGDLNICIGMQAGSAINSAQANICIGYQAGLLITSTGDEGSLPARNTCLGNKTGDTITTGHSNLCVGALADVTGSGAVNQIAIGTTTTCPGDNKAVIGNSSITDVYMASDSGATVHCTSVTLKEQADDNANIAGSSQIWVKNTGDGILMFTDDDGTQYTVNVTAV